MRELAGVSWSKARTLCEGGRVSVDGLVVRDSTTRLLPDAQVVISMHASVPKSGAPAAEMIVHVDRDVVVANKPAGLLSVPDEEERQDTLLERVRTWLRRKDERDGLAVVHRIDRETSGLLMFARTPSAQKALAARFRAHDVERTYHAIAHGDVESARIESMLLPDRGDGLRGSFGHYQRRHPRDEAPAIARHAVTFVTRLESLEGASLVECRLETGRQHQVRIHLAEAGHPLAGERVYIRDFTGRALDAPRTMLHARTLGFVHPTSGRALRFEREAPEDFQALLARLRRAA